MALGRNCSHRREVRALGKETDHNSVKVDLRRLSIFELMGNRRKGRQIMEGQKN